MRACPKSSGAEGGPGAGEMQECQIAVGVLLPTDQQAAEAFEPGMGALDHPATDPIARDLSPVLAFFSATADRGGMAPSVHQFADDVIVVAFVQAKVLRPVFRRWGSRISVFQS